MTDAETRRRVEKRIRDWLMSASETYAGPVGSEAWIKGLTGYIMSGPDSLTDDN